MEKLTESELKELFLEELRVLPNLSLAAKKLKIQTPRLYAWKRGDQEFWNKVLINVQESREWINDIAEAQLMERVQGGDLAAAKYWLKYNDSRYSGQNQKRNQEIKGPLICLDAYQHEFES